LRAGAEVDDEVDIAALRVEGVAGGRAEYIQALHAEPAAEPADFIAVRLDDAVHGRLAGKLCSPRSNCGRREADVRPDGAAWLRARSMCGRCPHASLLFAGDRPAAACAASCSLADAGGVHGGVQRRLGRATQPQGIPEPSKTAKRSMTASRPTIRSPPWPSMSSSRKWPAAWLMTPVSAGRAASPAPASGQRGSALTEGQRLQQSPLA